MTLYIVIITAVVSIAAFQSHEIMDKLIFNPYKVNKYGQWYRLLSSGFIHADWIHLIINMFVLYQFGAIVEHEYGYAFAEKGWYYFLLLYLGGIVISILPTFKRHKDNYAYNALGASGGVSAIVFTFMLFDPFQRIALYGLNFLSMPAIFWGIVYLVYSYIADKKGGGNTNHNAHFWGAIFGIIYTVALKPNILISFIEQVKNLFS
jgi:membrane associated rhomboid family serine protease